jgi:hypothetical protein
MSSRSWRTAAGLAGGVMILAACTGPVPVHETPGWSDSIAAVQQELASIQIETTPIATPEPTGDPGANLTTTSPNAVPTAWVDLRVGQCVLWPYDAVGDLGDMAQVVPCAEPHYGELYSIGVSALATYVDADLQAEADAACETAFTGYVGMDFWHSIYYYDFTYPTQSGWDNGGREWRCLVIESDNENTGSLRGVAQ